MKITAKVTFTKTANREFLIQAFFNPTEFSPANSITISNDKTAEIQLNFKDSPPRQIIKAMSYCVINELKFETDFEGEESSMVILEGEEKEAIVHNLKNVLEESSKAKPESEAKEATEHKLKNVPEESSKAEPESKTNKIVKKELSCFKEEIKKTAQKYAYKNVIGVDCNMRINYLRDVPEKEAKDALIEKVMFKPSDIKKLPKIMGRRGISKPSEADYMEIPKLEQFAKLSTDFQCFVEFVCMWLKLSSKSNSYMHRLTNELAKIEKNAYEYSLKDVKSINKEIGCKESFRIVIDDEVSRCLIYKGYHATMLPFLITVMKYSKAFPQSTQKADSKASNDVLDIMTTGLNKASDQSDKTENANKMQKQLEEAEESNKIQEHLKEAEESNKMQEQLEEAEESNKMQEQLEEAEESNKMREQLEEAKESSKMREQLEEAEESNKMQKQLEEKAEPNLLKSELIKEILIDCESINDTKKKIEYLYTKMGLLEQSKSLYSSFGRITMAAIDMEELSSIDDVFRFANLDPDSKEANKVRAKVSEWINAFCKKNKIKRMKVIAFLREVKQIFTT